MNHYQVSYILDKEVADEFRRLLAMASPPIRRVAEFFLRPPGQCAYDAQWTPGGLPNEGPGFSPVVARTTVLVQQLLAGRDSYVKALVHSFSWSSQCYSLRQQLCRGRTRQQELYCFCWLYLYCWRVEWRLFKLRME
ncbi:unnamed protein product [Alternaria alternata]